MKINKIKIRYKTMNNIFVYAAVMCLLFVIFKFLHFKYFESHDINSYDENKSLFIKSMFKDTSIMGICVISGYYLLHFLKPDTIPENLIPVVSMADPNF